jgi:hypothetical protein
MSTAAGAFFANASIFELSWNMCDSFRWVGNNGSQLPEANQKVQFSTI